MVARSHRHCSTQTQTCRVPRAHWFCVRSWTLTVTNVMNGNERNELMPCPVTLGNLRGIHPTTKLWWDRQVLGEMRNTESLQKDSMKFGRRSLTFWNFGTFTKVVIFFFSQLSTPISSPPKDPGSSGVETTSWPGRAAAIVGGLSGFSVLMVLLFWLEGFSES